MGEESVHPRKLKWIKGNSLFCLIILIRVHQQRELEMKIKFKKIN